MKKSFSHSHTTAQYQCYVSDSKSTRYTIYIPRRDFTGPFIPINIEIICNKVAIEPDDSEVEQLRLENNRQFLFIESLREQLVAVTSERNTMINKIKEYIKAF